MAQNPSHTNAGDDTQPIHLKNVVSEDTSPMATTLPHRIRMKVRRWLWLLVGITGLSLVATLAILVSLTLNDDLLPPLPASFYVTFSQNDETQRILTRANTVGDFFVEQGITLADEDALSHPFEALLTEDMSISIGRARAVSLTIDGLTRTIRTPFSNPYDVLNQANVTLQEQDRLWLDGIPTSAGAVLLHPQAVQDIIIERLWTVIISEGEREITLETTARTVGDALAEADIMLYMADTITPDLDEPLGHDATYITIERGTPIAIQLDGTRLEARVGAGTVGEALASAGVVLTGLDYVLPPEDTLIEPDMLLQVVRVTEEIISIEESIAYSSSYQADDTLELDARSVLQAGQAGIRQIDIRVRYGDGVEIGQEVIGTSITRNPVNEIIGFGTRIVLRTVDTPEGTREYWRHFRAYATSYHPAAFGVSVATTSIGEVLRTGIIGADPRIIPYRTNMYVPNYGIGIMADTGGPRSSPYWVDLGYSDEDWVSWSRYVDVYLLTPVPDNINYLLPTWTPIRGRAP